MAREVLYRRSFHSEVDLKGMESLLGLDRTSVPRKAYVDTRISTLDGGFEAPRNSLDIPFSGLLEMRRNSEVRSEEIPIGYELSRSLTTRRKNDEHSNLKPLTSNTDQRHLKSKSSTPQMDSGLDHKHRAPSVVARLMGLDALPHQQTLESSSRTVLPRECTTSSNLLALASERGASAEEPSTGKLGSGELSFRNHPQEKQLQDFKREFTARQALQERHSMPRLSFEGFALQQKKEQLLVLEPQMDSEEFLDALDFLNSNKDFFVKVLKDPHSSFVKHLQQPGGSFTSFENAPSSRQAGGKLSRSSLDHNPLLLTDEPAEWRKRQDLHQHNVTNKVKAVRGSRWGRDEEMPGPPRWRARGGSMKSTGRMGLDHIVPTRIVVLKPSLGKQAYRKVSSTVNSTAPLLRSDGIFKGRFEGKENVKQELKDRLQLRNEAGLVKEYLRDDKDGPRDVRVIAKQIVKHVKEDMNQRLLKDGPYIVDSLAPPSYTAGRKAVAQKSGVDASGVVDGDGYHRTFRDHPCRNDRENEHHRHLGVNGRRNPVEECKRSSHKQVTSSTRSFREPCKVDEGIHDSCVNVKQSMRDPKILRKTVRSNSFKLRDAKPEAPRVLPRSLSAPAAAPVENRTLENEQKGGGAAERATSLSKSKSTESSPFKERLLSLKDSFSLTRKRASKKPNPLQSTSPLDVTELSTGVQLPQEQYDARKEPCHSRSGFKWQTDSSQNDVVTEVPEKSLEEVLYDNRMAPTGLQQWASTADMVDTASETSLDKCEQPSPVSVLETPFQEESQSSAESRKTDSNCTDRSCELTHQLKADHKNISRNLYAEFLSQHSSCHSSFDSATDELLNSWNLSKACLESYGLGDAALACGSEDEMTYIMHVLSLSGLNFSRPIQSHTLPAEHGLNPSLFEKLEAHYRSRCKRGVRGDAATPLDLSSRRLLFDFIDEIVSSAQGRLLQPWAKSSNQNVLLCTGKQLLERIFAHINHHRFVPSEGEEEVLEDMASKDLMREAPWVPLLCDTQSVVIELERLICGELIRELVHESAKR